MGYVRSPPSSLLRTLLVVSLSQNTRSHSCRHRLTSTSTGLMFSLPSTARVPPRSVMVVLGVSRIPFAAHKTKINVSREVSYVY